jgi:hypothetical protein
MRNQNEKKKNKTKNLNRSEYGKGKIKLDEARRQIVEYLKKNNVPLTRENYLQLAYLGEPPKELDAEQEAMLPEEIRKNDSAEEDLGVRAVRALATRHAALVSLRPAPGQNSKSNQASPKRDHSNKKQDFGDWLNEGNAEDEKCWHKCQYRNNCQQIIRLASPHRHHIFWDS